MVIVVGDTDTLSDSLMVESGPRVLPTVTLLASETSIYSATHKFELLASPVVTHLAYQVII